MTRWITFGVLVVAISVGVTLGFPLLTGNGGQVEPLIPQPVAEASGPPPKLVLEGANKHDFGIMVQQSEDSRNWNIKNEGPGVLELWKGPEVCSCTVADLPNADPETGRTKLKPGESIAVKVTWKTREFTNKFAREVTIMSNDPVNPATTIHIEGMIYPPVTLLPAEKVINFLSVNNDKSVKRPVAVYSNDRPDMKIVDVVSTNPKLLEFKVVPLNDEECKKFNIKQGKRIDVIVKEGANLGPFTEEILIKTDHPRKTELKLTAIGRVEGPIAFSPRWSIEMKDVQSRRGRTEVLTMWVRGQSDTKFEVIKKPSMVDVEIVPAPESASDTPPAGVAGGKKYEFRVMVKPGTPSGLASDEIVIKTSHPRAELVRMPIVVFVTS